MANHLHDKQAADNAATATRWRDAMAAVAELLAWSDALDAARAVGFALGRAQAAAAEAVEADREALARAEGYAEAVADFKRAAHGIAEVWGAQAEADRWRWHVCCSACRAGGHRPGCKRCEDRTRATFGAPHPDDSPGLGEPRPTDQIAADTPGRAA